MKELKRIKKDYEKFKEQMSETEKKMFEKYFKNKPFDEALFEVIRIPLLNLVKTQCVFIIVQSLFENLNKYESYYKKLKKEEKDMLKQLAIEFSTINREIDKIMSPIAREIG